MTETATNHQPSEYVANRLAEIERAKLEAEIARLKGVNEALMAQKATKLGIKLHTSGSVSVYGLQRFPVSLKPSQWRILLASKDAILSYLDNNC